MKTQVDYEGVVICVYPLDIVNFDVLGDDKVIHGIETSFHIKVSMYMDDICNINFINWPIKRVASSNGKETLH